jgi:hypothetical protein
MIDKNNPYSYSVWLSLQKVNLVDDTEKLYMEYLKNWYLLKNKNVIVLKEKTKQEYLQLIKDLSYLFNKDEKDKFLTNINYENPEELIFAIPYFARKLKEIAKILNSKRNSVKKSKLKYNLVGSNDGIETLLYEYILKSFTKNENSLTQVPYSEFQNIFPTLSSVKNDFYIEIEELYDTNIYHDSDPSVDIREYVDVQNLNENYPFEGMREDEIIGVLNSRFIPRTANSSLSKVFQAYLDFQSQISEEIDFTGENEQIFGNELTSKTELINYQIEATKKYLGERLYGLTAIKLKDLNLPDLVLNLNLTEGNSWFIWPSGSRILDEVTTDNFLRPILINDSNFLNSGATAGETYKNSDLIFTDKTGLVEGAWLQGTKTISSLVSTEVKILPSDVREFIYPYTGFNLTTKGLNWVGHTLNDDNLGSYEVLPPEQKIELLKKYYTETLPNSSSNPFYLNNSNLVNDGAESGKFTIDSDVIIKRKNINTLQEVYNDFDNGETEIAFLYKFEKTDIPIKIGITQIYWPIKSFETSENIPLTFKNDFCLPVTLANLKPSEVMMGSVAGLTFADSDVIYKLNTRTSDPIEAAWLGSSTIQSLDISTGSIKVYDEDSVKCAKYIDGPVQPSLAFKVDPREYVSFIWMDRDTPANDVFKFFEHSPNCEYGKTSHDYYNDQDYLNPEQLNDLTHWKKCTCKSVNFSPVGHIGNRFDEYNAMTDLLFADPDGLGADFSFSNWKDTRNLDVFDSPQFAYYKLTEGDSPVGWGKGGWKSSNGDRFILKTGRRYTYHRSSLRRDNTSFSIEDNDIFPYYIIKRPYKEIRGICSSGDGNKCYDLVISLDVSNSQKLTVDDTKKLVFDLSRAILKNPEISAQIGLVVFNRTSTLISYLTKEYGTLEFNLQNYEIPQTPPQYRTNLRNSLILAQSILFNKIPTETDSQLNLRDLCRSLNTIISDRSEITKTLNLPQNCPKKLLVISDGQSNTTDIGLTLDIVGTLKNQGVEIYTIDVGLLSKNNDVMENLASKKTNYFNLESYLKEGDGDVLSFAQKIASFINDCGSVNPSWKKAIRNSGGNWVGVNEPSDMVLNPGDFLIYVHKDSVSYTGEDNVSGFSQPSIGFTFNAKLNGWDYVNRKFDPNYVGPIYGAKPFWGISYSSPTNEVFDKETNHFGGNIKFVNDNIPVSQPEISLMKIENGDFIQYYRRKNIGFTWNQPITLTSTLSVNQWNKIIFERSYSNLEEILRNGKLSYYGYGSEEKSDLLLDSYFNFKISRYNYFARNSFIYNQDLFYLERCDNNFVIFNTSILLEPYEPYLNLLNVHYPTIATVELPKVLVSEKQTGGYLTPISLGVSFYRGKGYEIDVDKNKVTLFEEISAEKIFLDPAKFSDRHRGLTKKDQISPTTIKSIDNRWLVNPFNAGEKSGMIKDTKENQKFTPYQTKYEITNKSNVGLTRQQDNIEFWTNSYPATWNNEKDYPLTYRKELEEKIYQNRKNTLLSNKGEIVQWRSDIYGNEYGLFKGDPTPTLDFPIPVIGVNSTYIGFGASTGLLTNEHWIHSFSWTSLYQKINYSEIYDNSNLVGTAIKLNDSIRMTRAITGQAGNFFYNKPIIFVDRNNQLIDWSVNYVFSMGGGNRADGITFILQSKSLDEGGSGGGIGYSGILNSVGIGYDTYDNGLFDPDNNHIELNVNGSVTNPLATNTPSFDMCGSNGTDKYIYNWITYVGSSKTLNVYINTENVKPINPSISRVIDLRTFIKTS